MVRRFQNPSRFQQRTRPNRAWSGTFTPAPINVPAASKVLMGGFTLSNPNIDETELRAVGAISVITDDTTTSEQQIGAFGMMLVTDLAVAAGAASIPGPITDREDDGWFVYVPIVQSNIKLSNVGIQTDAGHLYEFDSKAKRRVEEGRQIVIMVENGHATNAFNITMVFRLLSMVSGT